MMYQANTFLNKYEQIWCIKCDKSIKKTQNHMKTKISVCHEMK